MKKEDSVFEPQFMKRFFVRPVFVLLISSFTAGVTVGTIAVKAFGLLQNEVLLPLLFSGVPMLNSGFISCFSAILLNILIVLIGIFLLGVTAFGALGIPILIFYKGISVAVGILFLFVDGGSTLGFLALCFTPVTSAASLLVILFATRALIFSSGLARAGFSQNKEMLDFQLYFKDFMFFLCFSVAVSAIGALLIALYGLF